MFNQQFRREHWYVAGNPYQWRTWFRGVLPWCMNWMFPKGRNCEQRGSQHSWYNYDGLHSACYHCKAIRDGQLWRNGVQGSGEPIQQSHDPRC